MKKFKLAKFAIKRKQLNDFKGGTESIHCSCYLKDDGTISGVGRIVN